MAEMQIIVFKVGEEVYGADVTYINQETLIGGTSGKIIGYPCFTSPSAVADTVVGLAFTTVDELMDHMKKYPLEA